MERGTAEAAEKSGKRYVLPGPVTAKLCALATSRNDSNSGDLKRACGELFTLRRPDGFLTPADPLAGSAIAGSNS